MPSLHKIVRTRILSPDERAAVSRAIHSARRTELLRTYKNGRSPLHEAARFGRAFAVDQLLRRAKKDLSPGEFVRYVNASDSLGCPPLLYAAASLRRAECQVEFSACVEATRYLVRCASVDAWVVHEDAVRNDTHCGFGYIALDKITRALHKSPYVKQYANAYDVYNDESLVVLLTELATSPVPKEYSRRHPLLAHEGTNHMHYRTLASVLEWDIPAVAVGLWRSIPNIRSHIRDTVFNMGGPRMLRALAWLDPPELRDIASWHINLVSSRIGFVRQTRNGKRDRDVYIVNRDILCPWSPKTHALYSATFKKCVFALLVVMSRSMGCSSTATRLNWTRVVRSIAADHFTSGKWRGYPYAAFSDRGRC